MGREGWEGRGGARRCRLHVHRTVFIINCETCAHLAQFLHKCAQIKAAGLPWEWVREGERGEGRVAGRLRHDYINCINNICRCSDKLKTIQVQNVWEEEGGRVRVREVGRANCSI